MKAGGSYAHEVVLRWFTETAGFDSDAHGQRLWIRFTAAAADDDSWRRGWSWGRHKWWGLVALFGDGPTRGPAEYRSIDTVKQSAQGGNQHQYLWNVQPQNSGEFGQGGPYDQAFEAEWVCAEYEIDASNQSFALYIEGQEEISFENGAGNYDRSDIPDSFEELRVGWNNYQQAPPGFTAWIDDIAFDDQRIGCEVE